MLVEDFGEETREDDVGIGAGEVVRDEFGVFVKELLTAAAVVGQHDALLQSPSHRNTNDCRQKTPAGAAVDMQHVIFASQTKKLHGEQQTAQNRSFDGEDICRVAFRTQVLLQEFHLPGDPADAWLIVTY